MSLRPTDTGNGGDVERLRRDVEQLRAELAHAREQNQEVIRDAFAALEEGEAEIHHLRAQLQAELERTRGAGALEAEMAGLRRLLREQEARGGEGGTVVDAQSGAQLKMNLERLEARVRGQMAWIQGQLRGAVRGQEQERRKHLGLLERASRLRLDLEQETAEMRAALGRLQRTGAVSGAK